jgi:rhodanese-related sulfurtransferase
MQHQPGFLKLVEAARPLVSEVTLDQLRERMKGNARLLLIDVREDTEWASGHARGAIHVGKGVLERDIESRCPDKSAEIVMYCGGGFRSVLTCEVAQRMGYSSVHSLVGGYRAMTQGGWPMEC